MRKVVILSGWALVYRAKSSNRAKLTIYDARASRSVTEAGIGLSRSESVSSVINGRFYLSLSDRYPIPSLLPLSRFSSTLEEP